MIENLVASFKELLTQGHILKAFKSYSHIRLHVSSTASCDVILRPVSFLLVSCTNLKLLPPGKQLHAQIISLGLEQHPLLVPKLVSFYSKFSLLDDARVVAENCKFLRPLPWNLLISSFVKNKLYKEALSAYKVMVNKGIIPDSFTYPSVLKACSEELDVDFGRMVHRSISASCHEWNLYVHNALISMYGKFGQLDVARDLFDKMVERDDVSWNTMISCYASKGIWGEAFMLFDRMHAEGVEMNFITWNTIAGGCLRTGNFKCSLELLSQMRSNGFHLDPVAMIIGLGACSHIGALKLGKEIHGSAIRSCCDRFENVRNALITMYSRCNGLRHADLLFRSMEERSIITWNAMLSGYTHLDMSEEASLLFQEMLLSGVEPNYVTIASILPLCARVANLQHGKEFHCYIIRRKVFDDYLLLWNALVAMYARSGKLLAAKHVFDLMQKRDEVTYTSLIAGYGMQGEGHTAMKLFEEMANRQIKPDHVTMVAVLSACSHCGLVLEGQLWFKKMQSLYGIVPRLEHFSCMVDLYGRAGLLNKAKETITRMPYKPTTAMWATLLGACRIHGNTDIGEWAAEKLLELRPENSGYYVLIANMHAAAGCWNELAKVRILMRDSGVTKSSGCTWVDVGSVFTPFVVGDTSNPYAPETYRALGGLTKLMKDDGYVSSNTMVSDGEVLEETG
ncbi:Pentatricopeptide repeat-containing protein [Hibiscus syriacus]|uniref:Pentatricopeptide repeat-containing protein n=1 Tax=Hibiscus syriacus TaxID=106335 RepID=A0A6A3ANG6_HIBSY|nr:pentatricopeptide repeat-containing protein At1g71490-like [Hibiscus syriacus]KAE8706154.1 Pentatricopeptide repeat-containing protein [Hibiscus syriacus]